MDDRRYPFQPLADAVGLSLHKTCDLLNVSGSTAQEYRKRGVTATVADRLAVRAGFHPSAVWETWHEDELARLSIRCEQCDELFIPKRKDARFCKTQCSRKWWAREKTRRWRQKPEVAERQRIARRAYYAEHGAYERQRERKRYQDRRSATDGDS